MLDNAAKLRNNVVTLCCAKNRRQESSRVTSLLGIGEILKDETESANILLYEALKTTVY